MRFSRPYIRLSPTTILESFKLPLTTRPTTLHTYTQPFNHQIPALLKKSVELSNFNMCQYNFVHYAACNHTVPDKDVPLARCKSKIRTLWQKACDQSETEVIAEPGLCEECVDKLEGKLLKLEKLQNKELRAEEKAKKRQG
ncbi:hypothetical protein COCMIDRAFT_755 [Bipolaris oryzae ATCC 44560]|uniref:Uncharacterized protein n=1 Tax=Bipolaris oryzae ATCC 44560 TaxID=930090 RepID=W6ZFH2_COCMI|nr:uncharacterized protein COCMIDRAFT_755 [Bipolaris oryzae ATCC 44560]EUC50602.1 hypothetical protein COCMIDRAFT_755 [Bipolaris oryzae ATCC 44560]